MRLQTLFSFAVVSGACALLSACIDPQRPMQPDYGWATRSNMAAQIADPEPRYRREVEPASNGDRITAANQRYESGAVIQPQAESTK